MSRSYGFSVNIVGADIDKADDIAETLDTLFDVSNIEEMSNISKEDRNLFEKYGLTIYGNGCLCGGEAEEEFASRLIPAVWKANGAYCVVTVNMTCMEDLPYEEYTLGKEAYKELLDTNKGEK